MDQETVTGKIALGTADRDNGHARVVIEQAELELCELFKERAKVTRRIGSLKRTIVGLVEIFGDEVTLDTELSGLVDRKGHSRRSGITLACRKILAQTHHPMSNRDLCDELQKTSPALLAHHKDPLATVNTILNRLVSYGEAVASSGTRGQRVWLWATEPQNNQISPDRRAQPDPASVITSGI
jgi:hypothetical protein